MQGPRPVLQRNGPCVHRGQAQPLKRLRSRVVRRQRAAGGRAPNTTSWVSAVPRPELAPYNASKAALTQLARTMALEPAGDDILANCIAPGIVDAGMVRHQWDTDPDYRKRAQRAPSRGPQITK
jgi:NAD(P)-dependent dehydrogenase (short-subunit alcohol dehydrogenase family)